MPDLAGGPHPASLLVEARGRSVPRRDLVKLPHRLKGAVGFGMFYHLERHLFPRVPMCRLPALAERLDQSIPQLPRKQVF